MSKSTLKTASVLAFERNLDISDAFFAQTKKITSTNPATKADTPAFASPTAVTIKEKSVRGTISNRLKNTVTNDPAKLDAEIEKANLQRVDSAALDESCDTLVVTWSCKVLPFNGKPSVCNDQAYQQATKIRDLILADDPDFIHSLAIDRQLAQTYQTTFKQALQNRITEPVTHERNKQTLWVTNAYQGVDLDALEYTTIIPLYPSVLTHEVYQRINHLKFSDDNKAARDNRFKKTAEQRPYVSLNDLATLQLGGTKPQNVSLLMSKQGGRNYLLPSLPPIIKRERGFKLSKFASSIFSTGMEYKAREAIHSIFKSIEDTRNIVDVREARKRAIDEVLYQIFAAAADIRTSLPAGWSKDYELERAEKLWLDPKRADLEGEDEFKYEREQDDAWHGKIVHSFARWLNTLMQAEFKAIASDFGDAEHLDWEREIEDMKKRYERAGKGVFL